ncbi:MAG TPA: transglutaminase-like domain-containing protein [Thermoanaerobaculaceae bacterium]|nr:transglutaminase-like domain-containing protein [Thermoanaerobaculaceae bacterium]HPS78831.1 transglutaminase-like domain-containing protein [Thermoanaerobaculaceae bacterium]
MTAPVHQEIDFQALSDVEYGKYLDDCGPARDAAISICRPYLPGGMNPTPILAVVLFEWVKGNIVYVPDPLSEVVFSRSFVSPPAKTLQLRAGNCEAQTLLIASMLNAVGFQTRFLIMYLQDHTAGHIFTQVNFGPMSHQAVVDSIAKAYSVPAERTLLDRLMNRQRFVFSRPIDSYCFPEFDPIGNAWLTADTCSSRYFGDLGGLVGSGHIIMVPGQGFRSTGPEMIVPTSPISVYPSPDMRIWVPSKSK